MGIFDKNKKDDSGDELPPPPSSPPSAEDRSDVPPPPEQSQSQSTWLDEEDDARASEARYWLGETLYIREDYTAAAQAYAGALKGWPKATWAPDATVKLANALTAIQRTTAACQALTCIGLDGLGRINDPSR